MVEGKGSTGRLEWRVNVPDGTSETLMPQSRPLQTFCTVIQGIIAGFVLKFWRFLEKAWKLGWSEPKKFIHCLKVGMALSLVSLFYYMRPLYDGVGGNAMWAVMTVIVAFEYTVGATLCKCVNRVTGTVLAGSLGVGVHWVASQSGEEFKPIILQASVFLLAAAATFSRFIPSVKARFDYGAMIFILTFSLVSLSGYRVDELFELARQRASTVALGTSICILTSMLFCPAWAGLELHFLINRNLEKLANSLEGCVEECFKGDKISEACEEANKKNLQGYKCVLNSKATEESMANFARWEPAHGQFSFGHPWKQYLQVGASMRSCAYCIAVFNSCINSDIQVPESIKKHFRDVCMRLSSHSSDILRELALTIQTMTKSSKVALSVSEMNIAVQDLQSTLKSFPIQLLIRPQVSVEVSVIERGQGEPTKNPAALASAMDILPLATVALLLIDIAEKVEGIVDAVEELACKAAFKPASDEQGKQSQAPDNELDDGTVKTLQMV